MNDAGERPKASSEPSSGIGSRVAVASLLGAALILGCGGWAAQAELSGAVIAQGKVAIRSQVKLIQHRDGGIVGDIRVSNGDRVAAGAVLIRLDETQTKAELGVVRTQLAELEGRRARLQAERDGLDSVTFSQRFTEATETSAIAAGETRLFENNRATRNAQRAQLAQQIDQYGEQVRGLEAQKTANSAERKMVAHDLEKLRPLVKVRLVEETKTRLMERDLITIDGLSGEILANIARVNSQISEARLKIIELDQQVRTDAQRELRDLDGRFAELEQRLLAVEDRSKRMELRAPMAGIVNDLSVHTVNGVIEPGQTVMSIVPDGEDLVVEARFMPGDVDQLMSGQPVRLRFSAFNQRTTPEVPGRVDVLAAAPTMDPATGQPYFLSTVTIEGGAHAVAGKSLVPGMPVEVFASTGDRTALSYLLKPFSDQMMRSLREE